MLISAEQHHKSPVKRNFSEYVKTVNKSRGLVICLDFFRSGNSQFFIEWLSFVDQSIDGQLIIMTNKTNRLVFSK